MIESAAINLCRDHIPAIMNPEIWSGLVTSFITALITVLVVMPKPNAQVMFWPVM